MDSLSDILALLKPLECKASGFDMGGEWSIRFAGHDGIKCYALASGSGWLVVEGIPEPIRLEAGDCFLLPLGRPFILTSNLALEPMDAAILYKNAVLGSITTINGGGSCLGVGGFFTFADDSAQLLLAQLPPVVHLRSETDKAELRSSLERMRQELREQRPGAYLVTQQIATTMLVQALRLHMEEGFGHRAGWLFALADPQMRTAIHAIHNAPAHPWTIESLAQRCGMSRSVFAARFKSAVGASPMEYLTRWRMLLARDRLTQSAEPVSAIARSLGYDSESAFSKAFRRILGASPRELRRTRRTPSQPPLEPSEIPLPRYTGSNDSHPRMAS